LCASNLEAQTNYSSKEGRQMEHFSKEAKVATILKKKNLLAHQKYEMCLQISQ
jgi:hypothetical protein